MSVPSVTLNPGSLNTMNSLYPSLMFPAPQVISASSISPFPTFSTIPGVTTVSSVANLTPMLPMVPSILTYQDVNVDKNLRKEVTEYFFSKLLKNWLKYHYLNLYTMVKVSNGKANLVSSIDESKSNQKNDPNENVIKYEFIVNEFITKKDMYKLLDKFRIKNNLNWWDLKQYSDDIRIYIQEKVMRLMEKKVMSKH
jgi:hypothetical protein